MISILSQIFTDLTPLQKSDLFSDPSCYPF